MVLGELSEENKEDNYCNRKTYFDFKLLKAFICEKLLSKQSKMKALHGLAFVFYLHCEESFVKQIFEINDRQEVS